MKEKETTMGWKRNIDKLLFIIASVYLIGILAWFWKSQQQAAIARNNNPSNSQPSSPSEVNNNPVKPSSNLENNNNNNNDGQYIQANNSLQQQVF